MSKRRDEHCRMFVGVGRYDLLLLDQPRSLKEKRSVVRRLKDEIKNRLHLSVAEVEAQDLWQRAVLGVASVSPDQPTARRLLEEVAALLASHPELEILGEEHHVEAW